MSVTSETITSPTVSVSIYEVDSVVSDIESTTGEGGNSNTACLTPIELTASKYAQSNKDLVFEAPDAHEAFEFGDGDVCVLAGNTLMATHKYLLKRFRKLRDRMYDDILVLGLEDHSAEDFRNTLRILYASVIEEGVKFDPQTLTSALRLATTYEYPALRSFAIKGLQDASLGAIDRIQLAREFGLSSWKEPAYIELCERDEPITTLEASVLGLNVFVQLARIREKEQRRRGRDIDTATEDGDEENLPKELRVPDAQLGAIKPSALSVPQSTLTKSLKEEIASSAAEVSNANTGQSQLQASQDLAGVAEDKKENVDVSTKPCFISTTTPKTHDVLQLNSKTGMIELPVDDCTCGYATGTWIRGKYAPHQGKQCICRLPACAVRAFKNLQIQQIAHANSIAHLESLIPEIQTPQAPPFENHAEFASPHPTGSDFIQEEVRKWLERCRTQIECE
ncbi:hypothetical protein BDV93DRAFT_611864 [Ceratobasidium sp. AG-I]|nr:hypothetical protein BDV93DRAFT_611864 [Ceratobasidium sp. AG-I]